MLEPIKPQDIKQEKTKDERLFIVMPYRALKDKGLTLQRLRALMTICSYANHKGNQWAGVERLAEDMGISRSTMAAHVKYLTDRGYLKTVNHSYTVGKHAKPRAIIYDPANPPNDDDWLLANEDQAAEDRAAEVTKKERLELTSTMESREVTREEVTSLFRVWGKGLRKFGVQPEFDYSIFKELANHTTAAELEKIAAPFFDSLTYPPSSARVLLRLVKK